MTQIHRSVFTKPNDRVEVVEFDAGGGSVPPSFRIFTFAYDRDGALFCVGTPVLVVGSTAAFLGGAFTAAQL